MDSTRARHLLSTLADGVDPVTGEVLGPSSPLQHPDVIRALFAGVEALKRRKEDDERGPTKERPERTGTSWDDDEDRELGERFDAGASVAEMAQQHRRTKGAVRARLVRLGKVNDRSEAR